MIHETATRVSIAEFHARTEGKKLVLLYPWTNYRTLFLAHYVSHDSDALLYYRIDETQTTLKSWLSGMAAEFEKTLDGFGGQLKTALKKNNPGEWGEALAADLGAYRSTNLALYIDEFDRVPFDAPLMKFARSLVAALPSHIQIAVSSRMLNYQPWYEFVAKGDAIVLGTEYRKDDVMFTVEKNPRPALEVYALGRGYALVNGQMISNWDGALPRNLFFYFMDHELVTRDEIFNTFWPELSIKEATNVFHVTKRKISERISMKVDTTGTYEMTQYGGGFYTPSAKVIRHYDVGDFQAAIERSMVVSDEREEERLLTEAIDLYKAPYLQETEMPWMMSRRDHLRQLYAQALISMGRLNKRRSDDQTALGFFTRSLRETPEREDIHREVMNIYMRLGQPDEARRHYKHMADMLRKMFNINPSRESQELLKLIEAS